MKTILRTSLAAAMIFGLLAAIAPQNADAQGFFRKLFGGGNKASYVVRFHEAYSPGTIIVSFGDRRLYFIHERGEAISYPIAAPTGEASWSGTTHVSHKRVNPGWTPTPDMRRENPALPAYVPGGHPQNPFGRTSDVSGRLALSDPWNRCALDHWPRREPWLRPDAQQPCHRSLQSHEGWREGDRHATTDPALRRSSANPPIKPCGRSIGPPSSFVA